MKRGGPLKRRTPLKASGEPLAQGEPLKRRAPLRRSRSGLRATVPEPMSPEERALALGFYEMTLARCVRRGRLYVCPACGGAFPKLRMHAHHVVEKSALKRHVAGLPRSAMLDAESAEHYRRALVWDPANGLPVHDDCHESHTNRSHRLPRTLLDEGHERFAQALKLDRLLDRQYT